MNKTLYHVLGDLKGHEYLILKKPKYFDPLALKKEAVKCIHVEDEADYYFNGNDHLVLTVDLRDKNA